MPKYLASPEEIDKPVMVKYHGAKGGRGFFIAKDYNEFKMGIDHDETYHIQEYILGVVALSDLNVRGQAAQDDARIGVSGANRTRSPSQ